MNLLSSIRFFYIRKVLPGFTIPKKALVVDIGSGEKPFWRGDVFVDKLSLGNVQRASKFDTIHDFGIFVDSDVSTMPFKTGAFDFSFASHLLEHVEEPGKVIREITRISKAGYIEVPNGILETIKPFDSHLWFVFKNKKKLIFVRKSKYLHEVLTKNGEGYGYLLSKVKEPFIKLYWKKKIEYEIHDGINNSQKFKSKIGNADNSSGYNYYYLFTKVLRILFYKSKKNEDIYKIFNSKKNYVKKR